MCGKCYDDEMQKAESQRHKALKWVARRSAQLECHEVEGIPATTSDVDERMDSEHFNTRQAFLELCQKNHYQFDLLRRSKHSSMMVLYHLHNPEAPSFVQQCHGCGADLEDLRYRCKICKDNFLLCRDCIVKEYHKDWTMRHAYPHHHTFSVIDVGKESTEARQRSIQLHMQVRPRS